MIDLKSFRSQWDNTQQISYGHTRVNVKPLNCYIGYNNELNKSIIVISSFKARNLISSKAITIRQGRKDNLRFQIEINLLDKNLDEVFVRMCHDLLKFSEVTDEHQALKNFEKRYGQWHNLFENGKSGILTTAEQHGLIGELLFLRSQIIGKSRPIEESVLGWYGPLKEHQDFSYNEKWYEIKTVMEQGDKIQISSLEQLSRLDSGELVIYRLAKISGQSDDFDLNKFTLNNLAKNLIELLDANERAEQKFQSLLFQSGYIFMEEYDEQVYKLVEKINFNVDNKFPRLIKEKLPSAISSISYSLSIDKLKNIEGSVHSGF